MPIDGSEVTLAVHATLYSAIIREIGKLQGQARFKKTDRGRFGYNQK